MSVLNAVPNQSPGKGFVVQPPEKQMLYGPPKMAKGYRRIQPDLVKPRAAVDVPVRRFTDKPKNQTPGEGFVVMPPERPFYGTPPVMAKKQISPAVLKQAVADAVDFAMKHPNVPPATEPPKDITLESTAPRPLGMELQEPTWTYLPGKPCPKCKKRCLHKKEKMIECRNTKAGCTYRSREEALAQN